MSLIGLWVKIVCWCYYLYWVACVGVYLCVWYLMCDYGFGFYVDTGSLLGVLVWGVFGLVLFVFLDLVAF